MKVSEFDYSYPHEIIAQTPAEKRDHSRLMILDRSDKSIKHKLFHEIIDYLEPGDLLVLNDTKVIPANITGVKEGGSAKVEVLLARLMEPATKSRGSMFWRGTENFILRFRATDASANGVQGKMVISKKPITEV